MMARALAPEEVWRFSVPMLRRDRSPTFRVEVDTGGETCRGRFGFASKFGET